MEGVELREASADDVGRVLDFWAAEAHGRSISDDVDHRRKGIGARLVEEAVRRAATVGAGRVDAMVAMENDEAGTFWAAMGFRPNPRYVRALQPHPIEEQMMWDSLIRWPGCGQ